MATHFMNMFSRLWGLRVPAPARTPLGLCGTHNVSAADTPCFCGGHTVSLWQTQCLCVEDARSRGGVGGGWAGGSRATPTPLGLTNPHTHTHTHKIAILPLRGIMS